MRYAGGATEVQEPERLSETTYGLSSATSLRFADIVIGCHAGDPGLTRVLSSVEVHTRCGAFEEARSFFGIRPG